MSIKKILSAMTAFALSAAVCLSFAGCGEKKEKDKYTVGICQLAQHEALDAATKGFKDALTEKLGDKVEFKEQNAAGESSTCTTIVNQFVSSKVDLIFANATGALQAAVSGTESIPIVGTSITDYATALEIDLKDWTGKTGINATGTSDLAPLDKQAEMFKELLPNAKKVGILYCSGEANSKYQATEIAKYLKKLGIETKEYTSADSNDIAQVVTTACSEVDALYVPTDNTAASNTEIINNICLPAKVPVIAGEEGICQGCGVATLSISYYDLGYKTGEMAVSILQDGEDISKMAIEYAPKFTKEYNKDICDELGIEVPDGYEAIETEETAE